MDLELLGRFGWREGLIAMIMLLVVYILVLFVRMRRLHESALATPSLAAQSAVAAYTAIQQPESADPPPQAPVTPQRPADVVPPAAAVPDAAAHFDTGGTSFPWNEPPPQIPGQELIDALQREVYQLRCEVDELRAEVLAAREDVRQAAKNTAPSAPPLYNDAMQMAIQGHDATAIAHRCGLARAEADLIVALARNRRDGR
ncbi:MAG: hypothetical protein FAZ92_03076 [Accumulibacter sp.]|nr:MAG: hypothetical protein FAZ92_03076 [Accumulibacter sp.]